MKVVKFYKSQGGTKYLNTSILLKDDTSIKLTLNHCRGSINNASIHQNIYQKNTKQDQHP